MMTEVVGIRNKGHNMNIKLEGINLEQVGLLKYFGVIV